MTVTRTDGRTGGASRISCPQAYRCTALTQGTETPYVLQQRPEGWTRVPLPFPAPINLGEYFVGADQISCTAALDCLVLGRSPTPRGLNSPHPSFLAIERNGHWETQLTPPPPDPPYPQLYFRNWIAVSCSSSDFCGAFAYYDSMETGGGGSHKAVAAYMLAGSTVTPSWLPQPADFPTDAYRDTPGPASLSCPQTGTCVAVGTYPSDVNVNPQNQGWTQNFPAIWTYQRGAWSAARAPEPVDLAAQVTGNEPNELTEVACPVAGACTAVGSVGAGYGHVMPILLQQHGETWSASALPVPKYADLHADSVEPRGLVCLSVRNCNVALNAFWGYHDGDLRPYYVLLRDGVSSLLGPMPTAPDAIPGPGNFITNTPYAYSRIDRQACVTLDSCVMVGLYDRLQAGQRQSRAAFTSFAGGPFAVGLTPPVPGSLPFGMTQLILADVSCSPEGYCGATGGHVVMTNSTGVVAPIATGNESATTSGVPSHPGDNVAGATYVGLGDSYASGEGVDPYFRDGHDAAGVQSGSVDNRCHRSTRAYAELIKPTRGLAANLDDPIYVQASPRVAPGSGGGTNKYGSDSNVRKRGTVSWAFLACAGAVVENVLPTALGGSEQSLFDANYRESVPQLDHVGIGQATKLVTLSVGGNDVGFSTILQFCGVDTCNTAAYRRQLRDSIDNQRPSLIKLYRAIRSRAPSAKVIVTGYPHMFPATPNEQSCGKLRPWRGEQDFLRAETEHMNSIIYSATKAAGVSFVGIADAFSGHEVCGNYGEWINGPSFTIRKRLDDESFHPTLTGQAAYASEVNTVLSAGASGRRSAGVVLAGDRAASTGAATARGNRFTAASVACAAPACIVSVAATAQARSFASNSSTTGAVVVARARLALTDRLVSPLRLRLTKRGMRLLSQRRRLGLRVKVAVSASGRRTIRQSVNIVVRR